MSMLLKELADRTGAIIQGDEACEITGISVPHEADEGDLCFISDTKKLPLLEGCNASVAVLKPEHTDRFSGNILIHADPYYVYAIASHYFSPYLEPIREIHPSAVIHQSACIGSNVSIGAHVVIEQSVTVADHCVIEAGCVLGPDVVIGESCHLRANTVIHSHTVLGKRCIIHSNVVIGDDGFGFAPHDGKWERIVQMGNVSLGDDVEIGSSTTIDRAALDTTVIGNGVKIDNQVQIGHNVRVGDHSVIVACSGIGGSTIIGKNCMIGGATGIAGHLEIADGVMVTGMSQVTRSLSKAGGSYSSGTGILESKIWRRNVVRFRKLNELALTVKDLEKQMKALTEESSISNITNTTNVSNAENK